MAGATRDPFAYLNRILDAPHSVTGSIKKACIAVEECLVNNRDNLRGFFDKCFPNLLKRIFGYGDFEASWLNMVTKVGRETDAKTLVDLLSPQGKLFEAMASADADHLVQYIFPPERLPAHTQELLKDAAGRRLLDTWPQYRHRMRQDASGRPQVFLNVLEYFMFWTAFYVLRGNRGLEPGRVDVRASPSGSMGYMSGIRTMGNHIVSNLMHKGLPGALQGHPYYRLLRLYLEHFLPRGGAGAGAAAAGGGAGASGTGGAPATPLLGLSRPESTGSLFAMPSAGGGPGGGALFGQRSGGGFSAASTSPDSQGGVVLSVLVEFWLTDSSEPLPSLVVDQSASAGLAHSPGAAAPGGPGAGAAATPMVLATPAPVRMLTYQAPSEELTEALVTLVRYVYAVDPPLPQQQQHPHHLHMPSLGGHHPSQQQQQAGAHASVMPPAPRPAQAGRPPWLPETPVKTAPLPHPRLLTPPTALLLHGTSASAAVQAVSRKVYRQLRRAFSQWPVSSSSSMASLISLWLSVIAPWCPPAQRRTQPEAAAAAAAAAAGSAGALLAGTGPLSAGPTPPGGDLQGGNAGGGGLIAEARTRLNLASAGGAASSSRDGGAGTYGRDVLAQYKYTPAWRGHVLAHLPFYLHLLPLFVSLSLSRLQYRPDSALRDLERVLAALAASSELVSELRQAEAAYNAYVSPLPAAGQQAAGLQGQAAAARRHASEGEYGEMLTWWLDQAQDFEAAATSGWAPARSATAAASAPGGGQAGGGSAGPDLCGRLFSTDTQSAAYSACILLRNAETLANPALIGSLRQCAQAVLPLSAIIPVQPLDGAQAVQRDAAGDFPPAGRWRSLHYRGDPMLRPIASYELALLVRPLVRLSRAVNALLGLDRPYCLGEEEDEPPEHLGQIALLWARKKGYRVNLRFLAEKQVLLWLLLLALAWRFLAWAFGGEPGGGEPGSVPSAVGLQQPAVGVPQPAADGSQHSYQQQHEQWSADAWQQHQQQHQQRHNEELRH